ncbi:hypothetical protein PAEVO_31610 [Paenibacillus sp. GM2FR]|nr:hypothetical protein PAEVO_31610 [Paenibacillus sp. GM2FR]
MRRKRNQPERLELIRTYYIEGEVIGDSEIEAKEELIKLAHDWKVE